MRTILRIAWRTIWRNRRRTLISMSAVGVGLLLVILYSGMLGGVLGDATEQLDTTGMGHVEITAPGWRAHRRIGDAVAAPQAVVARLDLPATAQVGWRIAARGLIASTRASAGIELDGVEWTRERALSAHARDVVQGARPAPGDLRGALIGEQLARRLGVVLGAELRITVQRADGELGAEVFRVRGIFHSVSPGISRTRVLVDRRAARELLGLGDVAHRIVIQLDRAADADRVASAIRDRLGPGYVAMSYGEQMPQLRKLEDLTGLIVWIAALFIYGLVGLGILNTMLMSVLERTREFGVLRAIGTRPGRVVAQVLGESFWIATMSVAFGGAAGLAITWYGSTHSLIDIGGGTAEGLEYAGAVMRTAVKTRFSPGDALIAAALVYAMALVTALYPAWRVARLSPAEALHSK